MVYILEGKDLRGWLLFIDVTRKNGPHASGYKARLMERPGTEEPTWQRKTWVHDRGKREESIGFKVPKPLGGWEKDVGFRRRWPEE